ncbi:MAG: hypothetical protein CMB80_32565 [Flammeovirgaceae bacterium]|nr:hypothetical protein [Flammeovirgaceae bacterium]
MPLQLEAISGDSNPYSVTHPGYPEGKTGWIDPSQEVLDSNTGSDGDSLWARKQLYMNPQTINIRDKKFIKSDLTKGGFVTQYWGEDLTSIEVSGITGSSGIEGISVLRSIYRHEQLQYRHVLKQRQEKIAEAAQAAALEAEALLTERTGVGGTLTNVADVLTGGAFSENMDGLGNVMDIILAPFTGGTAAESLANAVGIPSLAAFATNVDMYYQGVFFRGYFENFSVTENAQEPGHFSYQFTFKVTRTTGERKNFMPWHKDPYNQDGDTVMTMKTTADKGMEGAGRLSYPLFPNPDTYADPTNEMFWGSTFGTKSVFGDISEKINDVNEQGVNRKKDITGE